MKQTHVASNDFNQAFIVTLNNISSYLCSGVLVIFLSISTVLASPLMGFEISTQLSETQQSRLKAWLETGKMADKAFNQATLTEQNTRLQVERLRLELTNAQQALGLAQQNVQQQTEALSALRQQNVEEGQEQQHQQQLDRLHQQLQEQQQRLEQTQVSLEERQQALIQAQQEAQLASLWHQQLQELEQYLQQQSQQQEAVAEQQKQRQRIEQFHQQLNQLSNSVADLAKRSWLEAEILVATENTQLLLQDTRLNQLHRDLQQLQKQALESTVDTLLEQVTESQTLRQQLQALLDLLQHKLAGMQRQLNLLNKQLEAPGLSQRTQNYLNKAQKLLVRLQQALQQQLEKLMPLLVKAEVFDTDLQERLSTATRQSLLQRRQLPSNSVAWSALWQEILNMPQKFAQYGQQAVQHALHQFEKSHNLQWLAGLALLWLIFLSWQRQRMQHKLVQLEQHNTENQNFSVNSLRVVLALALRYLPEFSLLGLLTLLILLLPLQHILFWLLLSLAGFWLMLQISRSLAWRLLVSNNAPEAYRDPKLYQQFSYLLWLAWIFTSLALLIHYLPFSRPLTELYDTFYILFLSLLIWPLLRLRHLTIHALTEKISTYWLFIIEISSLLFVLGTIAMSALALFGYINLAWALDRFLIGFLLLLTLWLVVRGYLNDAIVLVKNYALQHSPNYGLLWTQDIIPLLHKLLQIALVLSLLWLLLHINGLHIASEGVQSGLSYPLLNVGASSITVGGLVMSLFALWFVIWFGKWIRQITYRWIYVGIIDLGVRHSLSAFTQYLIVTIGLLIALNIMGVDLTTLTVFAGALGVGLGFGLKNVADNFISGVLLLIERPLRAGDVINIDGTYEGKVKQIGIRSLTINTWDNQDVIVPNSQLISTPFINWSHEDWVLRTVLYIGVSYDSDLKQVKALLESILNTHAAILKTPESEVFLSEFADSAIIFRVQYFIDADKEGLLSTKSSVLMKIWEIFKEKGIEIPYPQRDVHLKTEPSQVPYQIINDGVSKITP